MIHVTIEIWPSGDSRFRRTLDTITIANISDLAPISDYHVVSERHGQTHVRKFRRNEQDAVDLVRAALIALRRRSRERERKKKGVRKERSL